jgi:predicted nucleic acid-binding protein
VAGEFVFGQLHARVSLSAMTEVQAFLGSFEMISLTSTTAIAYARLRASLSVKGVILPDPDYWIAAHALGDRLPLITTDRDFRHLPELKVHFILPDTK